MKSARSGSAPRAAEPLGWAAAAPDDASLQASLRLHPGTGRIASPAADA